MFICQALTNDSQRCIMCCLPALPQSNLNLGLPLNRCKNLLCYTKANALLIRIKPFFLRTQNTLLRHANAFLYTVWAGSRLNENRRSDFESHCYGTMSMGCVEPYFPILERPTTLILHYSETRILCQTVFTRTLWFYLRK